VTEQDEYNYPEYGQGWRSILCRVYNGNIGWRILSLVRLDSAFYDLHRKYCPDLEDWER
jgi:hypothetical protein